MSSMSTASMSEVGSVACFEQAFFSVVQRAILPLVKQIASLEDEFAGLRLTLEQNAATAAKARLKEALAEPRETTPPISPLRSPVRDSPRTSNKQEKSAEPSPTEKPIPPVIAVYEAPPVRGQQNSKGPAPNVSKEAEFSLDANPAEQSESTWWQPRQPDQENSTAAPAVDTVAHRPGEAITPAAPPRNARISSTPYGLQRETREAGVVRSRPDEEARKHSYTPVATAEVVAAQWSQHEQKPSFVQPALVVDQSFQQWATQANAVPIVTATLPQRLEPPTQAPATPLGTGRVTMVTTTTLPPTSKGGSFVAAPQYGSFSHSAPSSSPSPRQSRITFNSATVPPFAAPYTQGRISPGKQSPGPQRPNSSPRWAVQPTYVTQLSSEQSLQWLPPRPAVHSYTPTAQSSASFASFDVSRSAEVSSHSILQSQDQARAFSSHPDSEQNSQVMQQASEEQVSELTVQPQAEPEAESQDDFKIPAGVPIMERCSSVRRPHSTDRRNRDQLNGSMPS